jgi:large subunit ribosomal protein L10
VLRAGKEAVVGGLHEVLDNAGVVVVTHYKGLTVAEMTELRRGMRAAGASFRVTKNSLAKLALVDTEYAGLGDYFTGPTGIAVSADPVAAPKAAVAFAKKNDKLVIVGGGFGGQVLPPEKVRALADLPTLDELRAKIVGLLTTPASRIVGVLQAPGGQIARVLAAHAEQAGQ